MGGLITGTATRRLEHDFVFAHGIDIEPDAFAGKTRRAPGEIARNSFLFAADAVIRPALLFDLDRGHGCRGLALREAFD